MSQSHKESGISGAKWNGLFNFTKYLITFALSIILARLLEPADFGLIGMISILTGIAAIFIDSGFSISIIQMKNLNTEDFSSIFFFNIIVSFSFYIIIFFLAPFIADFYDEPQLTSLTRIITLVFVINSFGNVQSALLFRNLNFKKRAVINLSGIGISAIIASIMAFKGFGIYSIVGQVISQAFVTNSLYWLRSKWRPKNWIKKNSFTKTWNFSSKLLLTDIIGTTVDNIDNILIGKVFSASQLGYYVRARSSKMIFEDIFSMMLSATALSVLSKVSDNISEFRRLHLHFFKLGIYAFFPVVFGTIATAEAFTVSLFSDKWLPAVPLLQILALTSITRFISSLFYQTMLSAGNSSLYFKLKTTEKILRFLSVPFGLYVGLYAFVWANVIIGFGFLVVSFIYIGKVSKVSCREYLSLLFKPLILSVLTGLITYSLVFLPVENSFVMLFSQVTVGIATYILLSLIFKVKEYYYIKDVVFEQLSQYKKRFFKHKKD